MATVINSQTSPAEFLEVPGGRIAFDDSGGAGPLVVLAPGMGDTRGSYRFLAPLLVKAGFRVVTFDLRGFGESAARWDDLSVRAVGRDIAALIRRSGGPAIVVGNSYSGGAAVWTAVEAPETVSALVFAGAFVRDVPAPAYMKALFTVLLGGPWAVASWMAYWNTLFKARKPADHAAYAAALAANLREDGRIANVLRMSRESRAETEAILDRVRVPALALFGTKDPDFPDPAAEARLIADRTGGEIALIEGAGHYPQVEFPEQVAGHIASFSKALR